MKVSKFSHLLFGILLLSMFSCSDGTCDTSTAENAGKCYCEASKSGDKEKMSPIKKAIDAELEKGTYTENELEAFIREHCK